MTLVSAERPSTAMFFDRRPRWGLTWRGIAVVLVALAVGTTAFIRYIHAFLAVNAPVPANMLVIEGWMPEYAIRNCAPIISSGSYRYVVALGGPVPGVASPAADDDTHAYVAAAILRKAGVDRNLIAVVPTHTVDRDRTYNTAMTLERWLAQQHITPQGINVLTLGPHARRSRLLFRLALGPSIPIGVIPIKNSEYDDVHWWRYSEGVKEVVAETAGYVYARCFFFR